MGRVSGVAERLREARERRGFKTPTEAARHFRWKEVTYRAHENANDSETARGLRPDVARKYAKGFGVSPAWLLYGEGDIDDVQPAALSTVTAYEPRLENGIPEVEARTGAGPGDFEDKAAVVYHNGQPYSGHPVKAEWVFPPDFLRHELRASPANALVLEVVGDSMGDTLRPGDRVLVDTGHNVPYPDGIYVIDEGFGPLVKRLQVIRRSEPAEIEIISDNAMHKPYRMPAESVRILGRVCGRVSRM